MIQCKTCGKYWDEKTKPPFEVSSEDGLVKCRECMTTNKKEKMIPLSIIDALITELEEIMDVIEPYDHPDFLYEHKERLREWYIELRKLLPDAV